MKELNELMLTALETIVEGTAAPGSAGAEEALFRFREAMRKYRVKEERQREFDEQVNAVKQKMRDLGVGTI